ncbi:MAG: RagB/SusD family nutrient uptake outer membrane protein [Candidatus Symbiothrix sp.]|jgi:tetratricopeptide (TPR) repeat protein|nr:RagB/SusD family nutrient uptake outer membrane protein [Candidatus Symbiothrix sp.]
MNRKITIYGILLALTIFLSACSEFTEIEPKGRNILNRVSDLDLLLNFDYSMNGSVSIYSPSVKTTAEGAFWFNDVNILVNDIYPRAVNVLTLISAPTKSLEAILVTSDESADRATLTTSDIKYEKYYFIIANVANIVIANADEAIGDREKAKQLKAEAYILRAYFHYLLVNFYARAYDPATAATDPGVPYVKEDNRIGEPNKKSTVAEVYANILSDINAAFELKSLPQTPVNTMRVGEAFAYAVKAKALLAMHNYPEALAAANASLALNDAIWDHREFSPIGTQPIARPALTCPEDLFYATYNGPPVLQGASLEILNDYYEPGNIFNAYAPYHPAGSTIIGIAGVKLLMTATYNINNGGLSTIDMYLTKAECLARTNQINEAMNIINYIRERRVIPTDYSDLSATTEAEAMVHLKKLSRIECLFTCKNYLNIKRWNTETAYKETIRRTINGITYELKADSPLWIFPFPQNATNYNPNLTQNY